MAAVQYSAAQIIVMISYLFNPLSMTIVVFNPFYRPYKSQLLGTKCEFKHQDLLIFRLKLNK